MKYTTHDVTEHLPLLRKFMTELQIGALLSNMTREERQFFIDKIMEMVSIFQNMPKTYEQDGLGDEAMVYLHYFFGGNDWYITERDMENDQLQTFGYVQQGIYPGELGYISIYHMIKEIPGIELDLYFTPTKLKNIKNA